MPLFGSPQASQNLTAVLDNLLKYAQEDALQQAREKSQMDYLGTQQQGYIDLANLNSANTSAENRVKHQEALGLEGTKYNFKNREIRDQMVSDLAKMAPVQQLSGMDFYNKQNGISDPTTTIALHQTVQNAALAQAKVIKGADLNPKEIDDIMSMGPTLTKDLLDMNLKSSQFNQELPIKQSEAASKAVSAGASATGANASMLDAQTKATTAAGKDQSSSLAADAAVLKDFDASLDKDGIIPGGTSPTAADWNAMQAVAAGGKSSKDSFTPEVAGKVRQFVTELRLQVASGEPLTPRQRQYLAVASNRFQMNKSGFNPPPGVSYFPSNTGTIPTASPVAVTPSAVVPTGPAVAPSTNNLTEANIQATMTSIKALRPGVTDPAQLRQLAIKYLTIQK